MDAPTAPWPCPRCAQPVEARFYGPCPACREELLATQGGELRDVEAPRFEPRVHVTPNAVATKE